jgi:hypothetical protein
MMTKDQSEIVKMVYKRFMDNESDEEWDDIDNNLEFFSYLTDSELIKETKIKIKEHSTGVFRCRQEHDQQYCFAPFVLEAVEVIVALYNETEVLHPKNAYILSYYLVMSEMGLIFSSAISSAV